MKRLFPAIALIATALLGLFAACSGGDDDDDDSDTTAECGVDLFTENYNACTGQNNTPDAIEQQYQDSCASPDEMIACACEAYRDNDCDAADDMLYDCTTQFCLTQK